MYYMCVVGLWCTLVTQHIGHSLFLPRTDSGDVSSTAEVATLELLADLRPPTVSSWRTEEEECC